MAAAGPDLEAYRARVEELLRAPGPAADARHAELFSAEAVRALLSAPPLPRAQALARFTAEGHLRLASAAELRRLDEGLRTAGPGGVAPRAADALLAAEPSRERRRALQAARLHALGTLVSAVADAQARRVAAAAQLGAASPAELIAGAAGVDLRGAAALGAAALDASEAHAGPALDRAARAALGEPLAALDAADLARVLRAPQLEPELPPGGARQAVARTAELLGLPPPEAPDPESAGLAGYAEALRLGGLALARAGASARLPVEARRLGDPAVAIATAVLLEGLLGEPAWLVRVLQAADTARIVHAARAVRLAGARAAAARAAALLGGDRAGLMSRALGMEWPEELVMADALAGIAPADAIRGRALAGLLRRHLRERSGERWFADPRAGALLRELWLEGGDLTAEGIARELGTEALSPDLIVDAAP